MDGVSVASGIAGLITLALQVSGAVAEYVIAIKDKSENVKELHGELLLLGGVLSQLQDFLVSEKVKGRSFDSDSVLRKSIKDCYVRIERIGEQLRPSTGGRLERALDRAKWPFQQKEVFAMIDNLRRYTQIFQFAVNIENCTILSKTSEHAEESLKQVLEVSRKVAELSLQAGLNNDEATKKATQVQQIIETLPILKDAAAEVKEISLSIRLAELRDYERRTTDILNWLSPLSSLSKHRDVQAKRAEDTGQWLLEREDISSWVSDTSEQRNLLCIAGPGAGKTIATSLVIDHLRKRYSNSDSVIAYFYCDYNEQQAQTPLHFASTLLRQLCNQTQSIPTCVGEFYQRTRNEVRDQTWFADIQSILHRVVKTFKTCFFVVDALDELPAQQRTKLLDVLLLTYRNVGNATSIRIFATCRPHLKLQNMHFHVIEISANEGDIRAFITKRIDEHPDCEYIMDATLRSEIVEKVCQSAKGMFLLPALQIEEILDQDTKADVRRKLNNLSTNLDDLYASTSKRILSQPEGRRTIARKTLMWLSHVKRALSVEELQHALAIRLDDENAGLDPDNILLPKTILDSCLGLVVVEPVGNIIKFHHFSVEEYLHSYESHGLFQRDECDLMITRVLLIYMSLPVLKTLPFKNRIDFMKALEGLPLLDYASFQWGHHARDINVDRIKDLVLPFVNSSMNLLAVSRVREMRSPDQRKWRERMFAWAISGGAGVSLAASFGLDDLVRLLIDGSKQNLTARNFRGGNALHEAAMGGYQRTAELLVSYGMDVTAQDLGNSTPLYLAVAFNKLPMVQTLSQYGREQLEIRGPNGRTPLHKACDTGSVAIVVELLKRGAIVGVQDDKARSPLHLAARKGHLEIVKLLILASAPVHVMDAEGLTPLDLAATGGHLETVQLLLDHGGVVNHKADDKWTPLHRAGRGGHSSLVSLLIDRGADLLDEDYKGNTPIFSAVRSGSLDVVKLMLDHQPEIRQNQIFHKDRKGATARVVAFYTANYHIHKHLRLIEREYTPLDRSHSANRLSQAIEENAMEEVEQSLNKPGMQIDSPDDDGQPPLHVAIQERNLPIASLLLSRGASIDSIGYHGWSPLQIAASLGELELVNLCLAHGANVLSRSGTGQTALHKACSSTSISVVRRILDAGADPAATNSRGMTALHIAAHRNRQEVARMLVGEYAADVLARDKNGDSASRWAERSGHLELLAYLRSEEKRSKRKTADSRAVDGARAGSW